MRSHCVDRRCRWCEGSISHFLWWTFNKVFQSLFMPCIEKGYNTWRLFHYGLKIPADNRASNSNLQNPAKRKRESVNTEAKQAGKFKSNSTPMVPPPPPSLTSPSCYSFVCQIYPSNIPQGSYRRNTISGIRPSSHWFQFQNLINSLAG